MRGVAVGELALFAVLFDPLYRRLLILSEPVTEATQADEPIDSVIVWVPALVMYLELPDDVVAAPAAIWTGVILFRMLTPVPLARQPT